MSGSKRQPDARGARLRSAIGPALMAGLLVTGLGFAGPTWAQTTEDPTHQDGGGKGAGGGGANAGGGGHEDGHTEEDHEGGHNPCGPGGAGGHDTGGSGCGTGEAQGGHEGGEGAGKGQAGQGGRGSGGPVWAHEGIPEVELGRLNVARAPAEVLDRAYAEALGSMTPETMSFYHLSLAQMVDKLKNDWGNVQFIDSPVQNLALFRDALDGSSILSTAGVNTDNDTLLAAFLGTASDKTIPVTAATASAVSTILGHPLGAQKAAEIAAKAEQIRLAILAGHG